MPVTPVLYNSSRCWGKEKALRLALGLWWQTRSITIHLVLNKGIRGSAHRESIIHREVPICNASLVHFYYSPHFNIPVSTRRPVELRSAQDLICQSAFCDLCPVLSGGHFLLLALNNDDAIISHHQSEPSWDLYFHSCYSGTLSNSSWFVFMLGKFLVSRISLCACLRLIQVITITCV